MADQINYKDAVLVTTLKKEVLRPAVTKSVYDGEILKETIIEEPEYAELRLDLPFHPYLEIVYMDGVDVTYSYHQHLEWEGREVLVLIDHKVGADELKVKSHKGYISHDWNSIKSDERYMKHYKTTKADILSKQIVDSKTEIVTTIPYTGTDATEPIPLYIGMCKSPLKIEKYKEG